MQTLLLVIHGIVALALVVVVLLQHSEGGALGIGGGGFMSARGQATMLSRTTAWLAAIFMVTSIILAIMARSHRNESSLIDQIPTSKPAASAPANTAQPVAPPPATGQATPQPIIPTTPTKPAAPLN